MILLLWCICGGFLLHMYESNYFTMLMKPTYEKPIDTAKDIIDRGLSILYMPGALDSVKIQLNSESYIIRTLAKRIIVAKVIFIFLNNHFTNMKIP